MSARPVSFQELLNVVRAAAKHKTKTAAAASINMPRQTFHYILEEAKKWNITPNTKEDPRHEAIQTEQNAQIRARRLADENSRLQTALANAYRDLDEARTIRKGLLGLTATPLQPADIKLPKKVGKHLPEIGILHYSDFQWGETVSLEEMGGRNCYDSAIASLRLIRSYSIAGNLLTKHWKGEEPPARLVIILGGDLFSGDIHEELQETNDIPMPRVVKVVVQQLVMAIDHLLGTVACPIDIYSTPGNHGRKTKKPRHKTYVRTNFDALVSDLIEWHYKTIRNEKRINIFRSESTDALFEIYGWKFCATHGDMMGTKGGKGFIGPVAPITRGMKKVHAEYAALQIFVDYILTGHYHTRLMTEEGWANGSLVGPSEYSLLELRARPAPASQNFFSVHPEKGINMERAIFVGHPDEGSIYRRRS